MGKWYDTGFREASEGIANPPGLPGQKSFTDYMDGFNEGTRAMVRDANIADDDEDLEREAAR